MPDINLNSLCVENVEDYLPLSSIPSAIRKRDHRRQALTVGGTTVVFDNLAGELVKEIHKWPAVVGCVAWLTNEDILTALASRDYVSFVIQKEDWLRPDSGRYTAQRLNQLYSALPSSERFAMGCGELSYGGDQTLDAVRVAGIANTTRAPAAPRMHHKFLVFGNMLERDTEYVGDPGKFDPQVAWTGSFNLTHNGTQSLENALIIRDKTIANLFHQEWRVVVSLSEPLNWESEWVAPEFRIGS